MNIAEKKNEFVNIGATTLIKKESLYNEEQWEDIKDIIFDINLPTEVVEIGDVGEPNQVIVARFMTDVHVPTFVNEDFSKPLIDILFNSKVKSFFETFLDKNELYVRRCQLNKISKNGFIGKHLDCDSNPDYIIAVILHFNDDFEGGEFIYYPNGEGKEIYTEKECLIISSCLIEHEVKKVMYGNRNTLVFFLSDKNSNNKSVKLI